MATNYRKSKDECPSCGATYSERSARPVPHKLSGLSECPQCGSLKCCMCDMGDDVECPSCNLTEEA